MVSPLCGDEMYCRLSAAALPEAAKTIQPGCARWKCTPIPAYGGTSPGGGKFTLRSALEPISTSKHSAAKICPSGEDVVGRRGAFPSPAGRFVCFPLTRQGSFTVLSSWRLSLCKGAHHRCRQAAYILPSEPARSVGRPHRSVRQHMTDRTRAPKAPEPPCFREYSLLPSDRLPSSRRLKFTN